MRIPDRPPFSLSRRQFVLSGALALTAFRFPATAAACTLAPEQEEGPYYIDGATLRGNVKEDKAGVPFQLRVALVDAKRCTPLQSAALDIWHCDATGVYSGFTANGGGPGPRGPGGFGGPPGGPGRRGDRGGPPSARVTDEARFLRGVQLTNKQGIAEFQTLYPGWYAGRTIHIHVKVHLGGPLAPKRYSGGHVSHTGQLFLPEDVTEQIAKLDPYNTHSNVHRTLQTEDQIFRSQGGAQSILSLERLTKGENAAGFVANITLAVDPDATPSSV
jgi:protocatechuate 3,4-dioxygenase beta subunit